MGEYLRQENEWLVKTRVHDDLGKALKMWLEKQMRYHRLKPRLTNFAEH